MMQVFSAHLGKKWIKHLLRFIFFKGLIEIYLLFNLILENLYTQSNPYKNQPKSFIRNFVIQIKYKGF